MSHARKSRIAWITGLLTAALLMALLFATVEVTYATNDDTAMLRTYMGYQTDHPQIYHRFLGPWLTGLLIVLRDLAPGVAWFSWWQLAMLWLSAAVILKNACMAAARAGKPMALGEGLGLLFLGACFGCYARITFTTTAALLGTAAVAQAAGIDADAPPARTLCGWLLCWALLVCSAVTRSDSAMVAAGFCAGVFGIRWLGRMGLFGSVKAALKPMIAALCAAVVLVSGLVATRAAVETPETLAYEQWQSACSELLDYHDVGLLQPEDYEPYGWTKEEIFMLSMWYTLDENMSTEALKQLSETLDSRETAQTHWQNAEKQLGALWKSEREGVIIAGSLLCLFLLCIAGLGRRKATATRLMLWGSLIAAVAMLCYLALTGRLPLRAALAVLLPAAALWLVLAPDCLPARPAGRAVCGALCALTLALDALCIAQLYPLYRHPTAEEELEAPSPVYAELDAFALYEPDVLILNGLEFSFDYRLFPDTSDGVPQNIAFWGGWLAHSPELKEQFARFGIDADHFTAEDLLRDNVYYVIGTIDPPPLDVLNYVRSQLPDEEIEVDLVDESGGTYYFQFWRSE